MGNGGTTEHRRSETRCLPATDSAPTTGRPCPPAPEVGCCGETGRHAPEVIHIDRCPLDKVPDPVRPNRAPALLWLLVGIFLVLFAARTGVRSIAAGNILHGTIGIAAAPCFGAVLLIVAAWILRYAKRRRADWRELLQELRGPGAHLLVGVSKGASNQDRAPGEHGITGEVKRNVAGGVLFVSAVAFLGSVCVLVAQGVAGNKSAAATNAILGYAGCLGVVLSIGWLYSDGQRRRLQEWLGRARRDGAAPGANNAGNTPAARAEVEARSHAAISADGGAAHGRIVCMGDVNIGEAGDHRFEPQIVTPTETIWRCLLVVPLAVGWALVLAARLWPASSYPSFLVPVLHVLESTLSHLMLGAATAGVVWLWKAGVRPKYLRLAPGIVQVLEYRWFWSSRPMIRSYAMAAGTLALVVETWASATLTLMRAEQVDLIRLSDMRHSRKTIERVWQALLSTAPTPALSDEYLVG